MSSTPFSRRRFLQTGLAAAGGLAFFGSGASLDRLASAQAQGIGAPDRYYIFCYFSGGWDVLLSLDPRDPRRFTNGNMRSTQIQPGYELINGLDTPIVDVGGVQYGAYMGDLQRHGSKIAVVRGMSMETLTHEVGRRRFLTGKPPAGLQARGSSSSTWLASRLGEQLPIPNLHLQVEAYNKDQPNYASALSVNAVPDLLRALRPSQPALAGRLDRQVDARMIEAANCRANMSSKTWASAEASRIKAREMVTGGYAQMFDFMARTPQMEALRDHFGITRLDTSSGVQAALAVQAITGGLSRVVSVQITGGLDTHFSEWATVQGPRQQTGFNAVARMIESLESQRYPYADDGSSWLDHTVIVGFSEFTRTPLVNDQGGRDHAIMNTCFLAGGKIQGGQAVGASSDVGMNPMRVDLATGRPSEDGEVILPEHILQTLYDEVGIGPEADMRVTGIPALMRS